MSWLEFKATLRLGDFRLDAEFVVGDGTAALFGPSGSGKTTVLRIIAGLVKPDAGRIVLRGRVVFDSAARINLPAHRRHVGLVFQDGLLFPHMSVRQNLLYGHWARSLGARRTGEPLSFAATVEILGIGHLLDRHPRNLSGGERQRVAIGRALLSGPAVLMMDEPVTAVDQERRAEILPYLDAVSRSSSVPLLYVSHNEAEIVRLSARVIRMEGGRAIS
jgi:molybdate transport system ATP-binding protein